MMKFLILILMVVFPTAVNAQVPMTTENRSLGPGTYEESMAQINGAPPPSDGYRQGWQSSKPGVCRMEEQQELFLYLILIWKFLTNDEN